MKKNIKDNRGYNQVWRKSRAMKIRTARRSNRIISEMDTDRDIDILEIGCGTGEMSLSIAKQMGRSKVLGTDLCRHFIDSAQKKYKLKNLDFKLLNFNNDQEIKRLIGNKKFDYVVGNGILHHLFDNIDTVTKQFNKLLKVNGKILFWEPNIFNPYCFLIFKIKYLRKLTSLEPGEMAFSKKYINKILLTNGFGQIKVTYEDFLLPNTPDTLINFSIKAGKLMEKIPLANHLSQSIFISARKMKQDGRN